MLLVQSLLGRETRPQSGAEIHRPHGHHCITPPVITAHEASNPSPPRKSSSAAPSTFPTLCCSPLATPPPSWHCSRGTLNYFSPKSSTQRGLLLALVAPALPHHHISSHLLSSKVLSESNLEEAAGWRRGERR